MKKADKQQGWFGIKLRSGEIYICNYVKRDDNAGLKRIKGFIGEISSTGRLKMSDTIVDETVGINVPQFRIPRKPEFIESDLEFLKICKKNKLNGEALDQRLSKSK
jgi:hypothetical protein